MEKYRKHRNIPMDWTTEKIPGQTEKKMKFFTSKKSGFQN